MSSEIQIWKYLEIRSSVPVEKFFKAFLNYENVLPRAAPQIVESCENSVKIKKIIFVKGAGPKCESVDLECPIVDRDRLYIKIVIIKANEVSSVFLKIELEITLEATPNGGSILKSRFFFLSRIEDKQAIDEVMKICSDLFLAIEAYLLANPDA